MLIFVDSSLSGLLTFQLVTAALELGLDTSAGDPCGWRNSERQRVLASVPLRARRNHHLWHCGRLVLFSRVTSRVRVHGAGWGFGGC